MKYLLIFFFISISLSADAGDGEQLVYQQDTNTGVLGGGYDNDTGQFHDICLDDSTFKVNEKPWDRFGLRSAFATSSSVSTKQELTSKTTSDATVGYAGNSAKNNAYSETTINSFDGTVLVRFQVIRSQRILTKIEIAPKYVALANSDIKEFRRLCGSHFLLAEHDGGYLFALFQVQSRTTEDKSSIERDLKLLFHGVDFGAKQKDELRGLLENRAIIVTLMQAGGSKTVVISNGIDDFLKKVDDTIQSIIDKPTPAAFSTRRYEDVYGFPKKPVPIIFESELNQRATAVAQLSLLDKSLADINYILQHRDEFVRFDDKPLIAAQLKITQLYEVTKEYLETCWDKLANCKAFAVETVTLTLPKRISDPNEGCSMQASPVCGVLAYKEERSSRCPVELYNAMRDPSCGVEKWPVGRTIDCGVERYNSGACVVLDEARSLYTSLDGAITSSVSCTGGKPASCGNTYRWKDIMGRVYSVGGPYGFDPSPRQVVCNHQDYGVALYKACEHENNPGIPVYKECRKESFKVERYSLCRHESHGVESYASCLVRTRADGTQISCR